MSEVDVKAKAEEEMGVVARFTVLFTAPRELWITYYAKIMETTAYALVNYSLMLHLITDLKFSDGAAGTFVGVFAALFSFFSFLAGALSDSIGVRKTLVISLSVCIVTRLLAALLGHQILTPALAFIPLAFGSALALPVMVAATRRYTNNKQGSLGFALLYVFMNVGFLIAGKFFDKVRTIIGEGERVAVLGVSMSVYQVLFLCSAVITVLGLLPVVLFMRRGVDMPAEGDVAEVKARVEEPHGSILGTMRAALVKTGRIFAEVIPERSFHRFLLFLAVIVGVRIVFHHMHYTLGPWADRELGYGSRFGTAWGVVNPFLIIVLTPLVGVFAARISSYRMIIVGTTICAAACFLLALPSDAFATLNDTSVRTVAKSLLDLDGDVGALYYNLVFFAVAFSIGEAIWSPRLYQYTASVAPKGREATYMGLSLLPLFLGKLTAGPLGGYLLGRYCPAEGARDGAKLWLVVALMALASPIFIVLFRRIIQQREDNAGTDLGEAKEAV